MNGAELALSRLPLRGSVQLRITTRVQFAPLSPSEIERFVSNVIGLSLPLLQRWLVGISPS